jgi:hypothetical protein
VRPSSSSKSHAARSSTPSRRQSCSGRAGWKKSDFLARIYDLDTMPNSDSRYKTAAGDIWQHRVNSHQGWPVDWVFTDSRFGLRHGDDERVLRFLAEMLHLLVRSDEEEVVRHDGVGQGVVVIRKVSEFDPPLAQVISAAPGA